MLFSLSQKYYFNILSLIFLKIGLYFWIHAVITQIFIPTAGLVKLTGEETNETNAEIETQPVIVEARISKFST